ncbi:DNA adenine methylase [Kordiimonas marina]|uniref:DNA adenine methylase n=1 Tax=Kordiimonas marina TaxID=2872312 RepID=UPI001FF51931|nr:DNA adenine methylase [Kordiimonas marina]MCJ9430752.1 DNA adenine methylase [Kordiimonas marina]
MTNHTNVTPIRPAAPYIGGKRLLAAEIIKRINQVPHVTYAEPFVGMGGVFLRRDQVPQAEVINDLSGDVATFFRILQRHYAHFMEMLKFQLTSRREFERLRAANPSTLTDLERAARFLYLQRTAFGGQRTNQAFGVETKRPGRFNVIKLGPLLEDLHERLAGVIIENLDYSAFIKRYDREATLFYLDPPYYGVEDYYGRELFSREDFEKLATQLATIKGKFILSLNDTPEVRHIFQAFAIEEVSTVYTAARTKAVGARELLISNCWADFCPAIKAA